MAITQVGTTTVAEAATGTSVTGNVPTGVVNGNLLIAAVAYKSGTSESQANAPTGWTFLNSRATGTVGLAMFYRWASSEPASYTFTAIITDNVTLTISAFAGVDSSTFQDVGVQGVTSVSSSTMTLGPVTTVTDQALELYIVAMQTTGTALTVDAALTKIADTTGTGRRVVMGREFKTPAGATTGRAFTNSGSLNKVGYLYSLRPATTAAEVTPTANAGADASVTVNTVFTRTGTDTNSPTARSWTIVAGPTGVNSTIGTAAALSWTPTVAGTYTLRYTVANGAGSASDDMVLTVTTPTPTASMGIVGGVTTTGAVGSIKTANTTGAVLVVATDDTFATVVATSTSATPDADGYAKASVTGLLANTRYRWGWRLNGSTTVEASPRGWFWTKRAVALAVGETHEIGFTSCFDTPASPAVLSVIAARSTTRSFIFDGDFGYPNITTNDASLFRAHYDAMLAKTDVATLTSAMSIENVWDDHDFGGDGSYGASAAKPAANTAWRQRWPTYTLPSSDASGIWRTWTEGPDIRVIMWDLRSQGTVSTAADGAGKTRLGAEQKAWHKSVIAAATERVIIIVSSVPPDALSTADDDWGSYATERAELDAYHAAQGKRDRIFLISGDMHAAAYDDGSSANNGFHRPVFQAAPSGGKNGSVKGGPYSSGAPVQPSSTAEGFAGLVKVTKTATGYSVDFQVVNQANTVKLTSPTFTVLGPRVVDQWSGSALVRQRVDVWSGAANAERQVDIWDGTTLQPGGSTGVVVPSGPAALATETFPGANGVGWPSQWTSSTDGAAVVDQQGGRGRLLTNSGGYALSALAYLSGMAAVADIDVTLDVTFTDLGEQYFFIGVRTDGTRAYYLTNSYSLVLNPSDTGVYFTHDQTSGSTQLGRAPWPSPWTANVARRVRYQVQGTTLRAKVWDIGTTEPSTWTVTATDTTLSAAGRLALQYGNGASGVPTTAYVDNITVQAPY